MSNVRHRMRRAVQFLLLGSLAMAIACLTAWALAYSPLSCYEALPQITEWPPQVCDLRFGMTFVFIINSPENVLAVVGVAAAYAFSVSAVALLLLLHSGIVAGTAFAGPAFGLLWLILVWTLDRTPYACAFGFGGVGCSGFLGTLGLYAVFLGWLLPGVAIVGTPFLGRFLVPAHDA
jgi:hypothetical protein